MQKEILKRNENSGRLKSFTRRHRRFCGLILFIAIFVIVINVFNFIIIPSKADVADMCEKHLRISRDFSNIERYDNASSKTLDNGDIIVTVGNVFYKIEARYDSNKILIQPLKEIYTIPFYPYTVYAASWLISLILTSSIVAILKKKDYFKKLD